MRFPDGHHEEHEPHEHVDEGTAHAFLDGQLPADEAAALEVRAASCAACAAVVAEARGLIAGATRVLGALDEAPVAPVALPSALGPRPSAVSRRAPSAGRRRRWYIPTAAAATMVMAVGVTLAVRSGEVERARLDRPEAAASLSAPESAKEERLDAAGGDGAAAAGAGPPPQQQRATTATDARNQSTAAEVRVAQPVRSEEAARAASARDEADFSGRGIAGGVARGAAAGSTRPAAATMAPAVTAPSAAASPAPPAAAPAEQTVAARPDADARMDSVAAGVMRQRAAANAASAPAPITVTGATVAKRAAERRDTVADAARAAAVGAAAPAAFAKPTAVVYLGCWSAVAPVDGLSRFAVEADSTLRAGTIRERPGSPRLGTWSLELGLVRIRLARSGREWLAEANSPTELVLAGPEAASVVARRIGCPR